MPALFARAGAPMIPGASLLPFVAGGGGEIPDLDAAADRRRGRRQARRRLRPGLRVRAAGRPPAHVPAHARVSAAAVADDRPQLPVPARSGWCTSTTGSPSTGRSGLGERADDRRVGRRPSRTTPAREAVLAADRGRGRRRAGVGGGRTNLKPRRRRGSRRRSAGGPTLRSQAEELAATADVDASPGDLGRRYASVSGDTTRSTCTR